MLRLCCNTQAYWNIELHSDVDFRRLNVLHLGLMWIAAYCVVAKESVSKQISIAFLERVKADFKKRYGGGKADTAVAKSLNKEFGYASWVISFQVIHDVHW